MQDIAKLIKDAENEDPIAARKLWAHFQEQNDTEQDEVWRKKAIELDHPEVLYLSAVARAEKGTIEEFEKAYAMVDAALKSPVFLDLDSEFRIGLRKNCKDFADKMEKAITDHKLNAKVTGSVDKLLPAEAYNLAILLGQKEQTAENKAKILELLDHASMGGIFQVKKLLTALKARK